MAFIWGGADSTGNGHCRSDEPRKCAECADMLSDLNTLEQLVKRCGCGEAIWWEAVLCESCLEKKYANS